VRTVDAKDLMKVARCSRCGRRPGNPADRSGWNTVWRNGVVTGFLCPDCQTPEENTEAVINEATVDYASMHRDNEGRIWVRPRQDEEP